MPWMKLTQPEMRKQAEERIATALGGNPQPMMRPQAMSLQDRTAMSKGINLKGAINGQKAAQSGAPGRKTVPIGYKGQTGQSPIVR